MGELVTCEFNQPTMMCRLIKVKPHLKLMVNAEWPNQCIVLTVMKDVARVQLPIKVVIILKISIELPPQASLRMILPSLAHK